MLDFAAIDFETANRNMSSVCSVGVVIVRNGVVTEKIYRLIRPLPNYYSYWNYQIHRLNRCDTDAADDFPEVWAEIAPKIDGLTLVAHSSSFDENCLKSAFSAYDLPYPDYDFFCTCMASKKKWVELPNHKLPTVAAFCGFDLINHHNALADAEAAAVICTQLWHDLN
jgi:DNA polymerase-3 subunit epsilon